MICRLVWTRGQVPAGARPEAGPLLLGGGGSHGTSGPCSQHQTHLTTTPRRPVPSLLLGGGHGGTETVSGVSGQALPGQEEERDSGDTGSERPGSAAAPAGTCWPGRPRGRGPAPESRPGPCPGPEAAPGCFWVWAPLHCLQKEGVSAASPRPVSTGTTRTGPASPGPPPEGRAGVRAVQGLGQEPRRRPAATISLGLGWAGTSPRGQGGGEQGVERLASGRSSLVLHLHQVSHVICEAAAAVNTMDRAGAPPLGPPAGAGVLGTPPKGVLMPGWLDGQGRPGLSRHPQPLLLLGAPPPSPRPLRSQAPGCHQVPGADRPLLLSMMFCSRVWGSWATAWSRCCRSLLMLDTGMPKDCTNSSSCWGSRSCRAGATLTQPAPGAGPPA